METYSTAPGIGGCCCGCEALRSLLCQSFKSTVLRTSCVHAALYCNTDLRPTLKDDIVK